MILQVHHLSLAYRQNQAYVAQGLIQPDESTQVILNDISFNIQAGQQISLVGKSGNGKSSLLYLLAGLEQPEVGTVFWDGQDLAKMSEAQVNALRNTQLGFIFQFHNLLPDFTALENVVLPALIAGTKPKLAQARAKEILDYMGLGHRYDNFPSQLSGGERQRVAIARALINRPKLLLADEPTGNLDNQNAAEVLKLLRQIKDDFNTSLLLVTHDADIAASFNHRWMLDNGKLYNLNSGTPVLMDQAAEAAASAAASTQASVSAPPSLTSGTAT